MSNHPEIQAAVRDYLHQQFPAVRSREFSDSESLLQQGIIDSMGILEIVTFIESRYGLTLSDDELMSDHFESIASIAHLIDSKTPS
jgi:acyl carrier protein